ncbi:MAG: hypothetical protein ACUVWJ_09890 [Spirochaetota bacterium]
MPFGMGPAGWAYVTPYVYPYARFPYMPWFWWGARRGWGRGGWGRGFGWRFFTPYWYSLW